MVDSLRAIFAANRVVILSAYGQVFFVLGLAIALQSWRFSRLALARSLSWLAAFGFTHCFYEWGDIFIPLQSSYLPAPLIGILTTVQSLLLAVSFACLFQFGVETLRPLPPRWRWLRYLPLGVFLVWCFWLFGPSVLYASSFDEWRLLHIITARYSMGFPGGLLAAYGLRRQSRQLMAEMQVPRVAGNMRLAALALAGYAVLGGLVVRTAPFFPANVLNIELLENWLIVPVPVWRSLLGLVLMLATIRTLEVFRVELDRRLSAMEEAQVLAAERERIGRELHDGTLQTVYAAGLLLQATVRDLEGRNLPGHDEITQRLGQSMGLLNKAVTGIRGYIGDLRQPDSGSLNTRLLELTSRHHLRSLVDVRVDVDLPDDCLLAPARIGHVLAVANEALSNVARHAGATRVDVRARIQDDRLVLEIADNGHGLPADVVEGYGLRNMQDRARLLGGELDIVSQPGRGTQVRMDVPGCYEAENDAQVTVS